MQQTQSLALQQVLSPQLQQSLLILQTPLLELRNLVQQEMETNPVLEELPEEARADERGEADGSADDNFDNEFQKLASLDEEWRGMRNGAITWRSRPAIASTALAIQEKHKISASSFSIRFPCRTRFSKT
jgi:DNA-directed RNA polymerase specialized sigma54-like protein